MVVKASENAGVPLYAVSFTAPDTIVVGGGGGQGAHGVKNKLVVYKLAGATLTKASEYLFPENSDSPTSLAASPDGTVWVGANAPPEHKANKHFQKLAVDDDGAIQWKEALDVFKSADPTTYQRATAVSGTMAAAASSADSGKVVVVSGGSNDTIELNFDFEISAMAFSEYDAKERKFVVAIGDGAAEFRNVNNASDVWARVAAPKDHKWTRVAFTAPDSVVLASTIGNRKGVRLTQFRIGESGVEIVKEIKVPRIAGVTALAAAGDKLAVAAPSGDLVVYRTSSGLSQLAILKGVHGFPVTATAVSVDGAAVVSVSLDGSVVVHSGLERSKAYAMNTVLWTVLSALILTLIVAFPSYYALSRASNTLNIRFTRESNIKQQLHHPVHGHAPPRQSFDTPPTVDSSGSPYSEDYTIFETQPTKLPTEEPATKRGQELHREHEQQNASPESTSSVAQASESSRPKVLEVPLHAMPGIGHGPVVHPPPKIVGQSDHADQPDQPGHAEHAEHAEL